MSEERAGGLKVPATGGPQHIVREEDEPLARGLPVDHLGIAVSDLSLAVPSWEIALGAHASPPELVPSQKVRVQFLEVGETHLELLEPTSPEATIAKFLEKRGGGLHHIAFRVTDLTTKIAELSAHGTRLLDAVPRPGARGRLVAFAHPASFGGVLTEFVQETHRAHGGAP